MNAPFSVWLIIYPKYFPPGDDMLTLSTAGKSGPEAVKIISASLTEDEDELKILIDGPDQANEITKFLNTNGFGEVVPEDDEGTLYLMASRKAQTHEPETEPPKTHPARPQTIPPNSESIKLSGILISCENRKYRPAFLKDLIRNIAAMKKKPDIIALMNEAVRLSVYSSQTCDYLKELEEDGVNVLVSESCADRLGITEAIGAGVLSDISGILGRIFECEKIVSV